ncbi:YihY/virulence factor BrkB family protein [Arenimonas terrae]|uniref:YihY/virulence factor BrkB family protein n=1 Tax=Arenimonas terrae TaxID=2546226 RepID=UPI00268FDDDA
MAIREWRQWATRWRSSRAARFVDRFQAIDLPTQAASLAFYALLSLAPLLVLVLWLTASLYPSAQGALLDQMQEFAGRDARDVARTVIENAERQPGVGSLAGFWSTVLLFVGASTVFARLQSTLNQIFVTDATHLRGGAVAWLRKRLFSFGVVLALGFLLLVSMLLTTAVQLAFANVPSLVPALGNAVTLLLYVLAFALLYHWLPDRRVRWKQALAGGLVTSAMFVFGRWAIGVYLARAAPGSAYGSFGTLVILLVWMYYAALIFFAGALITAVTDPAVPPGRASPARTQ